MGKNARVAATLRGDSIKNVFDNDTVQWATQQADTANAEIRLGVNVFGFTTIMVNDNYPQATIANLPDPRRWGVRAGFRF